ncbi:MULTISPECIES: hypothetical protein [unclassified Lysinibacillus]
MEYKFGSTEELLEFLNEELLSAAEASHLRYWKYRKLGWGN